MKQYKINAVIQRLEDVFKRLITVNIVQDKPESEFPESWLIQLNDLSRDTEELKEYLILSKDIETIERVSKIETKEIGRLVFNGFYKRSCQSLQDIVLNIVAIKSIPTIEPIVTKKQYEELCKTFIDKMGYYTLNYVLTHKKLPENDKRGYWKAIPAEAFRFKDQFDFSVKDFNKCFFMTNEQGEERKLKGNDKPETTKGKIHKNLKIEPRTK